MGRVSRPIYLNYVAGSLIIFPHLRICDLQTMCVMQYICVITNVYMRTIILLLFSNIFMTFAWYGHLKHQNVPLWKAILVSWGIAFFEYCLQVPTNRLGYTTGFSAFQLKIIQEVITLTASQNVIASAANERIVVTGTVDNVVTGSTGNGLDR